MQEAAVTAAISAQQSFVEATSIVYIGSIVISCEVPQLWDSTIAGHFVEITRLDHRAIVAKP
jgi:hypothetical protein